MMNLQARPGALLQPPALQPHCRHRFLFVSITLSLWASPYLCGHRLISVGIALPFHEVQLRDTSTTISLCPIPPGKPKSISHFIEVPLFDVSKFPVFPRVAAWKGFATPPGFQFKVLVVLTQFRINLGLFFSKTTGPDLTAADSFPEIRRL